jgi:hypothetical protein
LIEHAPANIFGHTEEASGFGAGNPQSWHVTKFRAETLDERRSRCVVAAIHLTGASIVAERVRLRWLVS